MQSPSESQAYILASKINLAIINQSARLLHRYQCDQTEHWTEKIGLNMVTININVYTRLFSFFSSVKKTYTQIR